MSTITGLFHFPCSGAQTQYCDILSRRRLGGFKFVIDFLLIDVRHIRIVRKMFIVLRSYFNWRLKEYNWQGYISL